MLALLRTRRWQGFTALVLIAIIAFGLLSRWQWSRAGEKQIDQARIELARQSEIVPIQDAMRPWQTVELDGRFLPDPSFIVRQRPMDGANGVWVVNLFETNDGERLWVNRGWVPAARSARELPATPPIPNGNQQLTGAWVPYEQAEPQPDLPVGMIPGISLDVMPAQASVDGFVHVQSPIDERMLAVRPPQIDSGQNISYAVQWLAFAFVAIGGWWIMLRREARDHVSAN